MSICIQTRQLQWLVTMIYTATLIQDTWQIDSYNSISPWFMWDVSSMLIVDLVGYYALSMYMIFSTHATTFNLRWLSHVAVVQQLSGTGEFRLELQTIHQQQSVFIITENAQTRAFSWLKVDMKFGCWCKDHNWWLLKESMLTNPNIPCLSASFSMITQLQTSRRFV